MSDGLLAGIGAALALGMILAAGPAGAAVDPGIAASRRASLRAVATVDDHRLADLIAGLQAAVDAGRRGSARIIDGDTPPGQDLQDAAAAARAAVQLALPSSRADVVLDGTMASVQPETPLPGGPTSAQLIGIDTQLLGAASAAEPFVQRRMAAAETVDALARALAALEGDRPHAALRALERAKAARAIVAAWDNPPTVLPFWLDTTGSMLSAARRIARATMAGDKEAAGRAGRDYQDAALDARRADTALALAISESGASLASTPLARLADALEAATARRAAMASVLQR
jgi:hypothetical protein